jgi:hypothetical protein
VLPHYNTIPSSHKDAKKFLTSVGLPMQFIHGCVNDYILYEEDYKDLKHCPKCQKDCFRIDALEASTPKMVQIGTYFLILT